MPYRFGACITEGDDFVAVCSNRALLDVGLPSLHDLRADSLIRPIASRSVNQLLSNNHCHFNNHDYNFILHISFTQPEGEVRMSMQAGFSLYCLYAATGWTSLSLGARSPGLRSRQIVLVLSVGDVRR